MEGHWKFLGGGGLGSQILEASMKINWNFLGGWGCKTKTFCGVEYRYYLEKQHNLFSFNVCIFLRYTQLG